jgi:hypothetical protein
MIGLREPGTSTDLNKLPIKIAFTEQYFPPRYRHRSLYSSKATTRARKHLNGDISSYTKWSNSKEWVKREKGKGGPGNSRSGFGDANDPRCDFSIQETQEPRSKPRRQFLSIPLVGNADDLVVFIQINDDY